MKPYGKIIDLKREELKSAVLGCKSKEDVLKRLGYAPSGSTNERLKEQAAFLSVKLPGWTKGSKTVKQQMNGVGHMGTAQRIVQRLGRVEFLDLLARHDTWYGITMELGISQGGGSNDLLRVRAAQVEVEVPGRRKSFPHGAKTQPVKRQEEIAFTPVAVRQPLIPKATPVTPPMPVMPRAVASRGARPKLDKRTDAQTSMHTTIDIIGEEISGLQVEIDELRRTQDKLRELAE